MRSLIFVFSVCISISFSQTFPDTSKAKQYFRKSFQYPLFSQAHQHYLDSALVYDHSNPYYWQQKSMPLSKMKKYELAISFIDSAVKYDKTMHWREYRAFIKCIFQKNYTEAIKDFQYVKQFNENGNVMDHSFKFHIGLSYLQLNEFDSAEKYMLQSIDFWEKSWKMGHYLEYLYLGIVYNEKANYPSAIRYLDSAIKYYPQFSDAKFYKSRVLNLIGQKEASEKLLLEAKLDYDKGFTINEDNAIYEEYPYQIKKYWLVRN